MKRLIIFQLVMTLTLAVVVCSLCYLSYHANQLLITISENERLANQVQRLKSQPCSELNIGQRYPARR